ncbi:YafY family protein [Gordonia sp. ABSL1-1]|uniref:helix-turn-helix transcriptional regulator n=1 Tax=Gordonia sp. ABSL1-1 TaxID=3053923 RepID=UPI002572356E|nr:YafY family protein [Gordonia sp. ABSL1-1]MDL9938042.1 YafY family protein [Gordonia sp. ABSL1-1]
MRAERLLAVLMLLKTHGRMTAAQLATELDVSERTVLRDIDALSLSGVPVYAERGRHGGFALLPGYRTDLSGLTLDEARSLVAGTGRIDSPALTSAMRKVAASLPEQFRESAVRAAQRILVRPEGFVSEPPRMDALAPVQQAVFDGRRIRMHYRSRQAESARERIVDPVGLIVARDVWYLVADSDGGERIYRVSRMSDVEILDEPARRSPDVDLEAIWQRRRESFRSNFEPVEVVIECAAKDSTRIPAPPTVLDDAELARGDRVRLRLDFGDRRFAVRALWLLALEFPYVVVEPDWVRDEIANAARRQADSKSAEG